MLGDPSIDAYDRKSRKNGHGPGLRREFGCDGTRDAVRARPLGNTTTYDDATAAIIFVTRPKVSAPSKALSAERYAHLEELLPSVAWLRTCLATFTTMLDISDEAVLEQFIAIYHHDASEPIAVFASGLQKDLESVKNCLRYPTISNGPMEGTTNKI